MLQADPGLAHLLHTAGPVHILRQIKDECLAALSDSCEHGGAEGRPGHITHRSSEVEAHDRLQISHTSIDWVMAMHLVKFFVVRPYTQY